MTDEELELLDPESVPREELAKAYLFVQRRLTEARQDQAELKRLQLLLADTLPAVHMVLEAERAGRTASSGHEDHDLLQAVARGLDMVFNRDLTGEERTTGWCLLVYGFNAPGISNYVSNSRRQDMIASLRETADRLERNQDNRRY